MTCHGYPSSTLTDNGMVFATRLSGGRGGRNHLEHELRVRNIVQKNSRPNHPSTCGKVDRFQQTLKKWLRAQPVQPITPAELQTLLDTFTAAAQPTTTPLLPTPPRNPGSGLPGPPEGRPLAPTAAPTPTTASATTRSTYAGTVTLRVAGRLHHIGIGRTHAGTDVILLVQDLHPRVVNKATGELLRDLITDPRRDHQPTGRPPGPTPTHN